MKWDNWGLKYKKDKTRCRGKLHSKLKVNTVVRMINKRASPSPESKPRAGEWLKE
jgi:hypothetical protein